MQDQILGVNAVLETAVHPDAPHLELVHRQALAGQNITHLAGADAKGDGAEGAVGGGMGIPAGDGHARLGEAQFGGDHMDDALTAAADAMEANAVLGAVGLQGGQHFLGQRISKRPRLGGGGHDVIDGGHGALRVPHAQPQVPQGRKSLGAGDLMDEVQANEQLGGAPGQLGNPMQIPDLVVEGAGAQSLSSQQGSSLGGWGVGPQCSTGPGPAAGADQTDPSQMGIKPLAWMARSWVARGNPWHWAVATINLSAGSAWKLCGN